MTFLNSFSICADMAYKTDTKNDNLAEVTEAKERRCLMCSERFASEWPGERICKRCRQTAAWRQG